MTTIKTISIIGVGNVGSHYAKIFHDNGLIVKQVLSRSIQSATAVTKQVNASVINRIHDLDHHVDLIIIAVPDDAIEQVIKELAATGKHQAMIVHTSGSVALDVFHPKFDKAGVLYPLQSISKAEQLNWSNVPLCIEGTDNTVASALLELASLISEDVRMISSEQRKKLHLAAVFANNFTNHLHLISKNICSDSDMDWDILFPLIEAGWEKAKNIGPYDAQTGPAVRRDIKTIKSHLETLSTESENARIYQILTKAIMTARSDNEN